MPKNTRMLVNLSIFTSENHAIIRQGSDSGIFHELGEIR